MVLTAADRFFDSFRFMASSLHKLAGYLPSKITTSRVFREAGYTDHQISLLTRKGVFPYEYVSSFSKLEESSLSEKAPFKSADWVWYQRCRHPLEVCRPNWHFLLKKMFLNWPKNAHFKNKIFKICTPNAFLGKIFFQKLLKKVVF